MSVISISPELPTIFDADNHYWETSDAFTRHRDPKYADRGVLVKEIDGRMRYVVGDEPHPWIPGPGDVNPRPRPGALYEYFAGRGAKADVAHMLTCEQPADHPEWYNRDARLRVMDEQGLEAIWLFPSQGVCMEGPMQPDIEAAVDIFRAFNRWLDDDWGFAYQNRIFGVPYLTLSDLDGAIRELEWAIGRGARIVTIRPGPVFTADGTKSPADPVFDPFWARVAEARLVVTAHAGFDEGHREVEDAIAHTWGYASRRRAGKVSSLAFYEPFVDALMHERRIHDFLAALVCHGLFERHPGVRFASIENGGTWVPSLLRVLQRLHSQNPGMFSRSPVDQFHENVWVSPFVEETVAELARSVPVERIIFGSDWPHAEGVAEPKDFLANVTDFPAADQRRIMAENARELTFG
ncbi:amidohydrolase [Frankia sp. CcI49]|uniref:amidohydrolase family protein n=1 Tax=Frankia sp. CcI49 TaxID=1745382 RepID=UPI0009762452|nr:amidohydrolase family protein [Frankia sp. CcI49]ONH58175.1 amidohydrolase [Frankia sp. CcI49]